MTDPFHSSRYSIERGKTHIDQLKRDMAAFRELKPYTRVVEPNHEGGFKSHKIRLIETIPPSFSGIIFDAANSLRSSLDQAGYAVARGCGKRGDNAHFPFGNDKNNASACIKGRSRDIPQEIFDHMMSFKPYKGGNDLLWALNNLSNTPKHEVIVDVRVTPGISFVRGKIYPGIEPVRFLAWDSAKNEMEISRSPLESTDEVDFGGSLLIAIDNVRGVAGQEVYGTLFQMLGIVQGCVRVIEDRARHFGFVR